MSQWNEFVSDPASEVSGTITGTTYQNIIGIGFLILLIGSVLNQSHTNWFLTPAVPAVTPHGLKSSAGFPEQSLGVNHSSHPSSHPSSAHPRGSSRILPCPASCSLRCGAGTATGRSYSWCSYRVGLSVICKQGTNYLKLLRKKLRAAANFVTESQKGLGWNGL